MSIFKKKKPEEKLSFKNEMAKRMASRRLRYVTERDGDTDSVIGKNGGFNIKDGQLLVSADNRVIFRCNIAEMDASELLSLEGVIITAPDLESGGKVRKIIAYYVYYR